MELELAMPARIEATEAVIGGERFLIVPAAALEGWFKQVSVQTERVRPPAGPARVNPAAVSAGKPKPRSKAAGEETRAVILGALRLKPMTTKELMVNSGLTYVSLQTHVPLLRVKGLLRTDEQHRHHLVNG